MKFKIKATDAVARGSERFNLRLASGVTRGFCRTADKKRNLEKVLTVEADCSVEEAQGLVRDGYAVTPDPFDEKAVEAAAKKEKK